MPCTVIPMMYRLTVAAVPALYSLSKVTEIGLLLYFLGPWYDNTYNDFTYNNLTDNDLIWLTLLFMTLLTTDLT